MALEFCDGFNHYTSLSSKWAGIYGVQINNADASSRLSGSRYAYDFNSYCWAFSPALTPSATYWVGQGLIYNWGNPPMFRFWSSNGRVQVDISCSGNSTVTIYRGSLEQDSGTLFLDSINLNALSSGNLSTWSYWEAMVTVGNPGAVVIRRNGETIYANYNLNTWNTPSGATADIGQVGWATSGNSRNGGCLHADFYACSDTGTYNRGFLGDIRVDSLFPTGDDSVLWTPSTGANYTTVDENPPNTTDYNSSLTIGQRDTFTYGDLPTTSGTVKGVQQLVYAAKSDAGTRAIRPVVKPTTTGTYSMPDQYLATSYTYRRVVLETNPDDSQPWDIADVNAAKFGYELTV